LELLVRPIVLYHGLGDLEAGQLVEVHHLQHLSGLGINFDNILLQSRYIWHIVISALSLFLPPSLPLQNLSVTNELLSRGSLHENETVSVGGAKLYATRFTRDVLLSADVHLSAESVSIFTPFITHYVYIYTCECVVYL